MFKSKYSNFLTIVLIITIIFVIILISILAVSAYKRYQSDKEAQSAINRFDDNINDIISNTPGQGLLEVNNTVEDNVVEEDSSNTGTRPVTYLDGFVMIGHISISKINIKLPILETETVASLEKAVVVRYPDHAQLNEPGNVVIAGHNYRNGQFFSNLKNVSTGDTIKITDTKGRTLTYTVYEKYETTPEDVAYIARDTGENTEITLVTCTDDSSGRIVVKAKA